MDSALEPWISNPSVQKSRAHRSGTRCRCQETTSVKLQKRLWPLWATFRATLGLIRLKRQSSMKVMSITIGSVFKALSKHFDCFEKVVPWSEKLSKSSSEAAPNEKQKLFYCSSHSTVWWTAQGMVTHIKMIELDERRGVKRVKQVSRDITSGTAVEWTDSLERK